MAKLVGVCRDPNCHFGTRQLPLVVDDTLTLIMQFTDACMTCNNNMMKNKDIEMFTQKHSMFNQDELSIALMTSSKDIFGMLSQVVSCVGCRRSVERLFQQLADHGHPAIEPLVVTSDAVLTLNNEYKDDPKQLCSFFNSHGPRLSTILDSIPKSKKNRRCLLHSLDLQRINRPMGNWIEVWELMSRECQEEVVVIEDETLLETLNTYLMKHRFCTECKSKVMLAFNILIGEVDPNEEKGYIPSLYYGIRSCLPERHVHVLSDIQFLSHLIIKAEPELKGGYNLCSQRERHAKTIEIAQEEVLTCLGIYLYERLHRIWQRLQEMEQIWQILFHVGVDCLKKNFELSLEKKRGYSQLELLCEEISKAEKAKELKKELKRQKKKKKKENKAKLEQDEKENQEKEDNQLNNNGCCQKGRGSTKSHESFTDIISCCSSSSSSLSCCHNAKSNCPRFVHTVSSCDSQPFNQNTPSDSGYFSSGGKCSSRDCLMWNNNQCHSPEVNSNEGDCQSCHSDQSIDSVSSEEFSDPCCKCLGLSANSDPFFSYCQKSHIRNTNSQSLSSCHCHMCCRGTSCGQVSSLQEMLQDSYSSDDDMVISAEDIQQFRAQQPQVTEKRRQLRQALQRRFNNFRSSASNLNPLATCKTVN